MRLAQALSALGEMYGQRPCVLARLDPDNPLSLAFDYEVARLAHPKKD